MAVVAGCSGDSSGLLAFQAGLLNLRRQGEVARRRQEVRAGVQGADRGWIGVAGGGKEIASSEIIELALNLKNTLHYNY